MTVALPRVGRKKLRTARAVCLSCCPSGPIISTCQDWTAFCPSPPPASTYTAVFSGIVIRAAFGPLVGQTWAVDPIIIPVASDNACLWVGAVSNPIAQCTVQNASVACGCYLPHAGGGLRTRAFLSFNFIGGGDAACAGALATSYVIHYASIGAVTTQSLALGPYPTIAGGSDAAHVPNRGTCVVT